MEVNKVYDERNREMLEIKDARICYLNFSGIKGEYNKEGKRGFSVVIPDQELADMLSNDEWNVKVRPPRDPDDSPFFHLPVKVNFNGREPYAYLRCWDNVTILNEETIGLLDQISIASVDMIIKPYHWTNPKGETGVSAYLYSIVVTQHIDKYGAEFYAKGQI